MLLEQMVTVYPVFFFFCKTSASLWKECMVQKKKRFYMWKNRRKSKSTFLH
jgi:hypothetical protein